MMSEVTQSFALDHEGVGPSSVPPQPHLTPHWRAGTTEQAISITRQAVEGLASWSLRAAA